MMTRSRLSTHECTIAAVLFLLTFALYARTIGFDFVNFDDDQYITENPRVTGGLSTRNIAWAFTTGYASNWHPLTWLSHQLDATLFGPGPAGPHGINALLHAANAALLFLALRRLIERVETASSPPAGLLAGLPEMGLILPALAAGLFAWHPLRAESVAWVSERKDLLAGLFWMLSLLAYERYARSPSPARYTAVLAMLALGLLSKPMLVTLPCALLLLDFWPLRRFGGLSARRVGWLVIEKLPMFAMVAASSVVTYMVQHAGRSVATATTISVPHRLANAAVSYVNYLQDTFWPTGLACFYPHPYSIPGGSLEPWLVWCSAGAVGAGSIAAIAWAVRAPWVFVGWFWFIGTLVPVIGLVQVGSQSHADRYTYIPSIGLCIAVVWTLGAAMRRRPRVPPVAAAAASVVLATLLILTHRQISTWRDTPTLMAHAIAVVPNNYAAHNNLGAWLHARGDDAGAMREFESVLRINPNDVIALNNYAARLAAAGDVARAKELLKTAIRRNPKFIPAYIQLGDLYVKESRLDDAVLVYRQARDQDREDPHALHALALALAQQGKLPEAIENWQFAVALNPTDPELQHHLGVALAMAGQARQGIEHLRRALSIAPDRRETLVRLAWILATHPDPGIRAPVEAERLARRAMNLANPPDATTLDTLAAAQAANGRFTDAVETARQALQRALDADDKPLVTAIAKRLTLYESGRPAIQGQ